MSAEKNQKKNIPTARAPAVTVTTLSQHADKPKVALHVAGARDATHLKLPILSQTPISLTCRSQCLHP